MFLQRSKVSYRPFTPYGKTCKPNTRPATKSLKCDNIKELCLCLK